VSVLRRILADNRIVAAVVFTGLLTTAGFYFGGVYPLERQVSQTRVLKTETSMAFDRAQETYARTRAAVERERTASADLDRFYSQILPKDLSTAREITHVRLAELAMRNSLRMERRNSQSGQGEFDGLVRFRTNVLLAGQWRDIRRFIAAVEDGSDFLVIEDIELSQREDRNMPVALTIEVATYYRTNL